jgi:ribonucleotide reductase beta subunit family protein with ferritin-like domain
MRKFNHNEKTFSKACGFKSDEDVHAFIISALAATEDGSKYADLTENEKIAILILAVITTRDSLLFTSTSRYVEALYTSPEDCIAIQSFIDQVFTKERLASMIESYTACFNAE